MPLLALLVCLPAQHPVVDNPRHLVLQQQQQQHGTPSATVEQQPNSTDNKMPAVAISYMLTALPVLATGDIGEQPGAAVTPAAHYYFQLQWTASKLIQCFIQLLL
jgi:hypothetical protein